MLVLANKNDLEDAAGVNEVVKNLYVNT